MKVTYRNKNNENITGEFISQFNGVSVFVPKVNPYGENRINISYSEISICSSDEDDSAIMVAGFIQTGNNQYSREIVIFHPIK